jgi:hypothetical protein
VRKIFINNKQLSGEGLTLLREQLPEQELLENRIVVQTPRVIVDLNGPNGQYDILKALAAFRHIPKTGQETLNPDPVALNTENNKSTNTPVPERGKTRGIGFGPISDKKKLRSTLSTPHFMN